MAKVEDHILSSDEASGYDDDTEQIENPGKKRKTSESESEPNLKQVQYNKKFTTPLNRRRKNDYDPEEEARLEGLVFGDHKDVMDILLKDDDDISESKTDSASISSLKINPNNNETNENDDKDDEASDKSVSEDSEQGSDVDSGVEAEDLEKDKRKPAWVDDDEEENFSVDKALSLQGATLPVKQPQKTHKEYLCNTYRRLLGTPKWADLERDKKTGSGKDLDNEEVFRHSNHRVTSKVKNLVQGTIKLKALNSINQQTRTEGPGVTNVQFHPTSTVALVAGLTGILSIFQVDGRRNKKLQSICYQRFPINTARFTNEGSEIVVGSQRHPHCLAYDLIGGKTQRIPLPHRMTNMEKFEVSPDGKFIAVCGRMGNAYLLTTKTKKLVSTFKMHDQCNTLAFSPDSRKLFTHGEGGEIYVWDVSERTCIHRAIDDGCLAGSRIAVSPSGQYLATGSKQGVVNVYDMNTVLEKKNPSPLKIILNLVTSITSLKFNPTSEILSMGSDETENAFKMLHLPSATIFSNFPSSQTIMWNPIDVDFSPNSVYLGISNNKWSAYLYRLKHYKNY